jgi:hypothetical protein
VSGFDSFLITIRAAQLFHRLAVCAHPYWTGGWSGSRPKDPVRADVSITDGIAGGSGCGEPSKRAL